VFPCFKLGSVLIVKLFECCFDFGFAHKFTPTASHPFVLFSPRASKHSRHFSPLRQSIRLHAQGSSNSFTYSIISMTVRFISRTRRMHAAILLLVSAPLVT